MKRSKKVFNRSKNPLNNILLTITNTAKERPHHEESYKDYINNISADGMQERGN